MAKNYTKLRLSKKLKHHRKRIAHAGNQSGKIFDKHVVGRWRNLRHVRRFVLGWLVLVALLITGVYMQTRSLGKYYLVEKPIEGGTFREGVIGNISNINPIFATSLPDSSASNLIFNSILKYDDRNRLIGDLAREWKVNDDGTVYTVNLRENVFWHDGQQFDAEDIVFTYDAIAHPDTKSYLNLSWQGIKVQAKDQFTVTFTLPNPFAPFPHSLTRGGILPQHILGSVEPLQLRAHPFNTESPIGTGPFKFNDLEINPDLSTTLRLSQNESYFLSGQGVEKFILISYDDREQLAQDFLSGDLSAASGVQASERYLFDADDLSTWRSVELNGGVYTFYKMTNDILKDVRVRKALTQAIDQAKIVQSTPTLVSTIDGPLIEEQLNLKGFPRQAKTNLEAAKELLDKAGWKKKSDGLRYKDDKKLTLKLSTQSSDDYPEVAIRIKEQLFAIGVDLQVEVIEETAIQDRVIKAHNYDILLFGISLGSDPDVYAFWHSSQASGFNLSEYEDDEVDSALEAGRTRLDKDLRTAKYKTFQTNWVKDVPATALYKPTFVYLLRDNVNGFNRSSLNEPSDRYGNVHVWKVVEDKVERYVEAF